TSLLWLSRIAIHTRRPADHEIVANHLAFRQARDVSVGEQTVALGIAGVAESSVALIRIACRLQGIDVLPEWLGLKSDWIVVSQPLIERGVNIGRGVISPLRRRRAGPETLLVDVQINQISDIVFQPRR